MADTTFSVAPARSKPVAKATSDLVYFAIAAVVLAAASSSAIGFALDSMLIGLGIFAGFTGICCALWAIAYAIVGALQVWITDLSSQEQEDDWDSNEG